MHIKHLAVEVFAQIVIGLIYQHFCSKSLAVVYWLDKKSRPATGDCAMHQHCWLGCSTITCRFLTLDTIEVQVETISLLDLNLGQAALLDHRSPSPKEEMLSAGYALTD